MNLPSDTAVSWYVSNDDGATWKIIPIRDRGAVDQDWTLFEGDNSFTGTIGRRIRFKAELHGNEIVSPRINKLGAILN